jgi:hypothetical protein
MARNDNRLTDIDRKIIRAALSKFLDSDPSGTTGHTGVAARAIGVKAADLRESELEEINQILNELLGAITR